MSRNLPVDTNILLDSALPERETHPYAIMLMEEFAYGEATGY